MSGFIRENLRPKAVEIYSIDATSPTLYNIIVKRHIVIDTNVLISALRSSKGASYRLLQLIGTGKFKQNISTPLMAEYEEVMKREIKHLSTEAMDDILNYLCAEAGKHEIFYLWRPVPKRFR